MLTAAQTERLEACARVLDPPARIVMTGAVSADARAAVVAGAGPGVELMIVDEEEVKRVDGAIDMLFIGPTSRFSAALDLFQRWPARVVPGGTLFVYGAFASPVLTTAMLRTIGTSRAWRYFGRDGALAEFVHAELSAGERVLDAIAQVAQLPYFARTTVRRRATRLRSS